MIFLSGWALWLLGLGAVVALVYFLKRQARLVPVSSLILWHGAEQNPKSALRLRWTQLLGLLLQLLALTFLVLGLAQPLIYTAAGGVERLAIILDGSASMRARSDPNSPTRSQQAVQQALETLHANPAAEVTLISAQAHSTVLSPPTHDHSQLQRILAGFTPTYQGDSDVNDLISLLQSQSPQGFDRVVYFTDHPPAAGVEALGWEIRLVVDPADKPRNSAITRFAVRKQPNERSAAVFIEVWNSSAEPQRGLLQIRADGKLIGEHPIELPPERAVAFTFSYEGPPASRFVARLLDEDAWLEDNIRYAALPQPRPWKILWVGQKNFYMERFLRLSGRVNLTWQPTWDSSLSINDYDLTLVHRAELPTPLAGHFLFVDSAMPPWITQGELLNVEALPLEAKLDHPLLAGIDPQDWRLLRVREAQTHPQGQVLLAIREIPLLYIYQAAGLRLAYLGIDLNASNLGLSIDFPILMYRLLLWLAPRIEEDMNLEIGGELPVSDVEPPWRIVDPQGRSCEFQAEDVRCGLLEQPGFYQILGGAGMTRIYAANTPPEESRWHLVHRLSDASAGLFPKQATSPPPVAELRAGRPLWSYLLFAGIILLLAELFYFDRFFWPLPFARRSHRR